jgi:methanogenic corrinoid protein MtbC1
LSSLDQFVAALLAVDRVQAAEILQAAAARQGSLAAFESLVPPALEQIGTAWEKGECALAQVYMSGRICEALADALPSRTGACRIPRMAANPPSPSACSTTTISWASNWCALCCAPPAGQCKTMPSRASPPSSRGSWQTGSTSCSFSTLMLPSALRVAALMAQLRAAAPGVRVIVGGAPFRFDPLLWQQVGADAMGYNASDAIALVRQMAGERQ